MATNIFVGGLPDSVDENTLEEWFSYHGDVLGTEVVRDKNTGLSRHFGFVLMADPHAAHKAIEGLDGCEWDGRIIEVKLANSPRRKPSATPKDRPETRYQSIYVSGVDYGATPEDLSALFSPFGEVKHVRMMLTAKGLPSGVAFVTIGDRETAERAIAGVNGTRYCGRRLTVALARRQTRRAA